MVILRLGAGLRVFELSYGKPAELPEDLPEDIDPFDVAGMAPIERARLVSQIVAKYPHLASLAPAQLLLLEPEGRPHPLTMIAVLRTPNGPLPEPITRVMDDQRERGGNRKGLGKLLAVILGVPAGIVAGLVVAPAPSW